MKLLHIADLHIGKRVNEFSMLDDQRYILNQILSVVKAEKPQAVLIAGDVYDKPQPSAEAVEFLDDFLTALSEETSHIMMISGNHDSPERLGFGSRLLRERGIHLAGVFDGNVQTLELKDEFGAVRFFLLPFLKPVVVRRFLQNDVQVQDVPHQPQKDQIPQREKALTNSIETYDDALRAVISTLEIQADERNVLLAHQFVTAGGSPPELSDSEILSIGGLDNVDIAVFSDFDYVALGHIHRPQRIGRDTVRYAGSPLKYSFSEALHQKSITLIELGKKNSTDIRLIPLVPKRDMRVLRGPLSELLQAGRDANEKDDYVRVVLTDMDEIFDAVGQLREVYPNLMQLEFAKTTDKRELLEVGQDPLDEKNPVQLFSSFYQAQHGGEMSEEQERLVSDLLKRILEKGGAS